MAATVQMRVRPEDLSQVPQTGERIPEPGIMVIFGASGDLTKRKLLPALFHLEQAGCCRRSSPSLAWRGGRWATSSQQTCAKASSSSANVDKADPKLDEFASKISYYALSFDDPAQLRRPESRVGPHCAGEGHRPRPLFYLATAPEYFAPIIENLGAQGMAQPEQGRVGVVIEKPFGHDLESARELNHQVNAVFHENQVFRIDHYLGKETVQNILVFRFANGIFEPIWNRNYIDHVQITAAETLGVEGRGPFYEKAGALRDVVQNHVMELLSFVAMEPPSSFRCRSRASRKGEGMAGNSYRSRLLNAVRGQYGPGVVEGKKVTGYRDEERVNPESGTETYAAVRLEIENWRWAGVPFYLRAGKRLKKRATEISIQFKQPPLLDLQPHASGRPVPGDSAQPAHHPHPAERRDCAALRGQGAHHAGDGRVPGEHGLRLCGGLWQIERQRL